MGTQYQIRYVLILVLLLSTLSTSLAGCVGVPNFTFSSDATCVIDQSSSDIPNSANTTCPLLVADVINRVSPAVVTINAEITNYDSSGCQVTEQLVGSGWILDANGFIVTNNHVVAGAKCVTVTLNNGQNYTAKAVMTDPPDDIAVIDIGESNISGVTMGDSSKIRVGDQVIAIGNVLGEGIKTTWGIISSTNSTFIVDTRETLYNTLETNAPIYYGDSGGPLFNMDGEVIGIITGACLTRYGTEVAGYAISSLIAKPIIQQLIRNGYVDHAWYGQNGSDTSEFPKKG